MVHRDEILSYVKNKYNTEPDYPWFKHPNYAVLRHKKSGKWYGLILNVPKTKLGLTGNENIEILNLKCEPELNNILRGQTGVLPAYHMNKEHWITIVLDSPFTKEEVYQLIDASYNLTK